jgi:hypothetical protein
MKLITITEMGTAGTGILLIVLGFVLRKQNPKKNWWLFVAGGAGMLMFALLVLFGAIKLA